MADIPFDLLSRIEALEAKVSELYALVGKTEFTSANRMGGHAGGVPPEVYDLAASGKKIDAIKRLREITGLGLREAKEAVDALGV